MKIQEVLRHFFIISGFLIIAISLIPLLRWDKWFIRIFDYPRSQKFWLNLGLLILFLPFAIFEQIIDLIYLVASAGNQIYLFLLIRPYTKLAPIQMKSDAYTGGEKIRVFVANVLQDNHNVSKFFRLIKRYDPDVILLVETDEWWANQTASLKERYHFNISLPLNNTYGMLLYSKFRLSNSEVRFLAEPDIPSIKTDMITANGQRFRFYALHPKPPVPNEAKESTERDAEILMVAKEAKKCTLPVIVAGDLNDVAWSYTTKLFLKVSELLDPRIGRGFFSTFHANIPLMRWPLDHIFCSNHFYLRNIRRMPDIGSDHFPMLLDASLQPFEINHTDHKEMKATREDIEAANEKILKVKEKSNNMS